MSSNHQVDFPVRWLLEASPVMSDNFLLGAESDAAIARKKAQEALEEWIQHEAYLLMALSLIRGRRRGNGH